MKVQAAAALRIQQLFGLWSQVSNKSVLIQLMQILFSIYILHFAFNFD
jgi:hypothetical protein